MTSAYTSNPLEWPLRQGMLALGLLDDETHVKGLLSYLAMIHQWNQVYNLTAVRNPQDMLVLHLLDSLSVVTPLRHHTKGKEISLLDVGAGAGLPGFVIALICPEIRVTALDAVAKKAAFMTQAGVALGLSNFNAVHTRVEKWDSPGFDVVTSRAFASLLDFTQWTGFHVKQRSSESAGVWMALKGKMPNEELSALPETIKVLKTETLSVPGLDAKRCIVWLSPKTTTI